MTRPTIFLVAVALYGQSSSDPAHVLQQARANIRATMKNIPKYSCTQTITRDYYAAPKPVHATNCSPRDPGEKPLRLVSTDRLRLEVAEGEQHEMHSWPGANSFDLLEIDQIVPKGAFGTGSFGGYLMDIFDNDAAEFDFAAEEQRESGRVLVYSYTVERSASHWEIGSYGSWTTTAFSGTFEVDPESFEVVRLVMQTPQLPAETRLCSARSILDLHRVSIGDGSLLLPLRSELHLTVRNGEETNNTTVFSDCREFQAHSALRFEIPAPETAAASESASTLPIQSPDQYRFDMRLNTTIDSDVAAAGDPVTAMVVHDVHPYKSKDVAIPAGAVAHGRLTRIEHHALPVDYVAIGMEFQSIEVDGRTVPFQATPYQSGGGVSSQPGTSRSIPSRSPNVRMPVSPLRAFIFVQEQRHVLPAGIIAPFLGGYQPSK